LGEDKVKIDGTYIITIDAFGKKNDPIGRVDGFALIVKTKENLSIGDKIQVKVTQLSQKFAFADLIAKM